MLTKEQAQALADLACAARPTGAPRWDAPGVVAALAKVRHLELAELLKAVGRAAGDRTLTTPAPIGNPSAPCWIERPIERFMPEKTTAAERCGVTGKPLDVCRSAPRLGGDTHECTPDFQHGRPAEAAAQIVTDLKTRVRPLGDRPTEES